jgi:hypothetical protein
MKVCEIHRRFVGISHDDLGSRSLLTIGWPVILGR